MSKYRSRTWIIYMLMLLFFGIFSYMLIQKGEHYNAIDQYTIQGINSASSFESFKASLLHNLAEPGAILLLQIISILVVARIFGFVFAKLRQPTVIGEILAGIVLGPSLLGLAYPDTFNFLFAPESLGNLYIISHLGLILFMFTIGMDLNIGELKEKMGKIYVISHASIIIPYFLGMLLAYFVYPLFAENHTDFLSFALFIGISMSITAFPVLARIVQEKGLSKSHLGVISIASAAIDDVTAWCILAAVIAIAKTGSFLSSIYIIGFSVLYVVVMLLLIRPFLKRIGQIYHNSEVLNKSIVAFLLLILIISSFLTEVIGIHALFGAFLAGVVMPPLPNFRKMIIEKVEDVAVTLLLPLFFVFTGLRTEIGLLNTPYLWTICGIFILVAIAGKFVGGAFTARLLGENWKDSLSIGILMNTRGLMELIVLNIGYEMGILPPTIFVMLVIMALVTTFMTTPVLSIINYFLPDKSSIEEHKRQISQGIFKALIAVGNPANGKNLLKVAKYVLEGTKSSLAVTALHITPGTNTNPIYGEQFSVDSFTEVKQEAELLNIPLETDYKVTDNIESGIVRTSNYKNFDFLLVGAGVSLSGIPFFAESPMFANIKWLNQLINKVYQKQAYFYPGSLIKDKTRYFIENSNCSVGVFVNRGFSSVKSSLVLIQSEADEFLIRYARRILKNNSDVQIHIMDVNRVVSNSEVMSKAVAELKSQFSESVKFIKSGKFSATALSKYSFMLISYQAWNTLALSEQKELQYIPSTLIINKKSSQLREAEKKNLAKNLLIDFEYD